MTLSLKLHNKNNVKVIYIIQYMNKNPVGISPRPENEARFVMKHGYGIPETELRKRKNGSEAGEG